MILVQLIETIFCNPSRNVIDFVDLMTKPQGILNLILDRGVDKASEAKRDSNSVGMEKLYA